jgi:hypothetical protein
MVIQTTRTKVYKIGLMDLFISFFRSLKIFRSLKNVLYNFKGFSNKQYFKESVQQLKG